jgi:tetratricopeptide (TPR) repeat protein
MHNAEGADAMTTLQERARMLDLQGREQVAANDLVAAARSWTDAASALRAASGGMLLSLTEMLERAAAASLRAGQPQAGLALAEEAVALLRGAHVIRLLPVSPLAVRLGGIGHLFCVMHRWDTAAEVLAQADAWFGDADDHALQGYHTTVLDALATAYRFSARRGDAIAVLERAVAMAAASRSAERGLDLAGLQKTLGQVLLEAGRPAEALSVLRQCVDEIESATAPHARNLLAAALNACGRTHAMLGQPDDAVSCLERSVTLMRRLVDHEGYTALADDLATAVDDLHRLTQQMGGQAGTNKGSVSSERRLCIIGGKR